MLYPPLLSGQDEDHDGSEPTLERRTLTSVIQTVRQTDFNTNKLSQSLPILPTPALFLASCLPSLAVTVTHSATR